MIRRWRTAALAALVALVIAGCSGTPAKQPGGTSGGANLPAPGDPGKQSGSPADPGKQPTPPPAGSLTEQLLALPATTMQPTWRWPKPAAGMDFQPLPNGKMLAWPTLLDKSKGDRPFVLTAYGTDGKVAWELPLNKPASDVAWFDVSPGGDTAAIFEASGKVHLIQVDQGKVYMTTSFSVDSSDPATAYMLTDQGQHVAVKRRTESGAVPWVLSVKAATLDGVEGYGAEGPVVHASPYHRYILGVPEVGGLTLSSPVDDRVATIPVERDKLLLNSEVDTTADGRTIYVRSGQRVEVYDNDGNLLFQFDSPYSLRNFAPLSGHFWNNVDPGRLEIITSTGQKSTTQVDPKQVKLWRVMPGGEGLFEILPNKAYCVVQPAGSIVGCFPFVGFKTAGAPGKTFFWVTEPGGTIAAYNGK